jgi:hypothetical protein
LRRPPLPLPFATAPVCNLTSTLARLQVLDDVLGDLGARAAGGDLLQLRQLVFRHVGPVVKLALGVHDELQVGDLVVVGNLL